MKYVVQEVSVKYWTKTLTVFVNKSSNETPPQISTWAKCLYTIIILVEYLNSAIIDLDHLINNKFDN